MDSSHRTSGDRCETGSASLGRQRMSAPERLPSIRLPSLPTGALVEIRAGRGPTVTLVLESVSCADCRELVDRLMSEAARVTEWGGRLRFVFPESVEQLTPLQNPVAQREVLSDPSGKLGLAAPALVIADEWGEIFFLQRCADHVLPPSNEIAEWTRFIAIQCPECEQPEGEWKWI